MQEYQAGSLPSDTIIPKSLYEPSGGEDGDEDAGDEEEYDEDDRRQMRKLQMAAAAIQQAQQQRGNYVEMPFCQFTGYH